MQHPTGREVVVRSAFEIQREIQDLKPIIRDELRRRDDNLTMSDSFDECFLSDALVYLHRSHFVGVNRFKRLGDGYWPDRREIAHLRIICEVTCDLSLSFDRELLAGLVVAIDILEAKREEFIKNELAMIHGSSTPSLAQASAN